MSARSGAVASGRSHDPRGSPRSVSHRGLRLPLLRGRVSRGWPVPRRARHRRRRRACERRDRACDAEVGRAGVDPAHRHSAAALAPLVVAGRLALAPHARVAGRRHARAPGVQGERGRGPGLRERPGPVGRGDHVPGRCGRLSCRGARGPGLHDARGVDGGAGLAWSALMKRYGDIAGDGGSNVVGQVEAQQRRLAGRLASVKFVVAVVSGKGGVGKSTLTGGLASAFAGDGWRVGVLDADLNGPTMAKILGVRGREIVFTAGAVQPPASALGVKVMSMDLLLASDATPLTWQAPTQQEAHTWRGTMEAQAVREFLADTAWGDLDALLIDLPPGTDRLATIASLLPALAGTVVVTIPSEVSQLVVRRSITAAQQAGAPVLGLVENMAGLFPGPDAAALAAAAGIPFLGRVPFDPALALACDRGDPFVATEPKSGTARAIVDVAGRVRAALAPGSRC